MRRLLLTFLAARSGSVALPPDAPADASTQQVSGVIHGAHGSAVAALTSIDVSWVKDEPIARFASGLARLDRRDGRLIERACGWEFGLTPRKPENPGDSDTVCDAE